MRFPSRTRDLARLCSLAFAAMLLAAAARAGETIPTPWTCEIPTGISLTGSTSGTADPLGACVIVVRRHSAPIPQAVVQIDFSACGGGEFALCDPQLDPGIVPWAAGQVITLTDALGRATFRLVGHATSPAGGGSAEPCARVFANGVPLGTILVSAYDLDGVDGVGVTDLSRFLADRFGTYHQRSDYDANGRIDPLDLSRFLQVRFAGGSTASCGAVAP